MLKVDPAPDYPTEEGRYLRGNDFSPVAVDMALKYSTICQSLKSAVIIKPTIVLE